MWLPQVKSARVALAGDFVVTTESPRPVTEVVATMVQAVQVDGRWPDRVSRREAEVLAALGEYLSKAQIANRPHISVRTVESRVSVAAG
ncbi:MAG TPA: hypothetical protein DGG94_19660 [Micromonosporaceae bacterium]|nr:hypothetical protein [Micromonosporaceae bacterium]